MAASHSTQSHLIRRFVAALLLIGLGWLIPASDALAQSNPLLPKPAASPAANPSGDEIDTLIKTLDDPKAREQLKQQLQILLDAQRGTKKPAVIEEQGLGAQLLSAISAHVESVSNTLVNLVEAIADMPNRTREAMQLLSDPMKRAYWLDVVIDLLGILATAFIAAWGARRVLYGIRARLARRAPTRWIVKLVFLPVIFLVEVMPAIAFALAGFIASQVFRPNENGILITSAIITAQIATMLTATTTSSLLAARAPGLRLFRLTDETAVYLQVWVRRMSVVAFYGYAISELATVIGVDPTLHEVITRAWGLLLAAMAVIFVLQNRVPVAQRIAGGPLADPPHPGPNDEPVANPLPEADQPNERVLRFRAFRRQLGRFWHVLAIAYIVAGYFVWSFQIEGGFAFLLRATVLTFILFIVVRLADKFLRQIFDRSFALPEDVKRVLPGLEIRANRYIPVLKQALLIGLYVAAGLALLQVWGLDMIGWLSDGSGRPVMAAIFKIVIILVICAILSEFVNLTIEHSLRDTDAQGRRIYHSGRMRTLLPLLRNAFRITLGVIVLMVILSAIGVDIAPLLAAAGVVGLAVGFGAQTLVKDIITGVFILMEDTIAIGDVVDLGGHAGVVEGMTIRTIRLRDLGGTVHTVPFSAVTIVQNLTKDFSYALWEIKIDYRGDVDRAMAVMQEVGTAIEKDGAFRYSVLGPIEIIGVDGFQDSGVVIKSRMKTRPMSQWDIMRAFNLRLKNAFDQAGILFAGVMAAMPPARATVHEITVKGDTATIRGDAEDAALVQAALRARQPPQKVAEAEAQKAEGKDTEPPASGSAPPSSPR